MRVRTRARELALQFLFQLDFHDESYLSELEGFLDAALEDIEHADTCKGYARRIVDGVHQNRAAIDHLLKGAADHWELHRMAVADRAILRIGCYELLFAPDVPMRVAINEAIELAKRYATEASGSFVNGLLDRIRRDRSIT